MPLYLGIDGAYSSEGKIQPLSEAYLAPIPGGRFLLYR